MRLISSLIGFYSLARVEELFTWAEILWFEGVRASFYNTRGGPGAGGGGGGAPGFLHQGAGGCFISLSSGGSAEGVRCRDRN